MVSDAKSLIFSTLLKLFRNDTSPFVVLLDISAAAPPFQRVGISQLKRFVFFLSSPNPSHKDKAKNLKAFPRKPVWLGWNSQYKNEQKKKELFVKKKYIVVATCRSP